MRTGMPGQERCTSCSNSSPVVHGSMKSMSTASKRFWPSARCHSGSSLTSSRWMPGKARLSTRTAIRRSAGLSSTTSTRSGSSASEGSCLIRTAFPGLSSGGEGEFDGEDGAPPRGAVHVDVSAQGLHHLVRDEQAEAQPSIVPLGHTPLEPPEEARAHGLVHADALVAHAQARPPPVLLQPQAHPPPPPP